ncbi:MAG: hypothetical protein HC902_06255 [Calothrix sp. SM1_5_4]|nr:hypothetical protein [Calothrix sp. SM1_5_4]
MKFGESSVLPPVTVWESEDAMLERFRALRDQRWLKLPERPDFLRRSSWLYPDDGCFARAALANRNLGKWSYSVPNKIFVFGDLNVMTVNAVSGMVSWWYHVAPIVEVNGQKYVLDPAIEPRQPLKLEDWLARMSSTPQDLEVAICGSGTYTPNDDCARISDGQENEAAEDQLVYLRYEWNRLLQLKRDPESELGDNPPW